MTNSLQFYSRLILFSPHDLVCVFFTYVTINLFFNPKLNTDLAAQTHNSSVTAYDERHLCLKQTLIELRAPR